MGAQVRENDSTHKRTAGNLLEVEVHIELAFAMPALFDDHIDRLEDTARRSFEQSTKAWGVRGVAALSLKKQRWGLVVTAIILTQGKIDEAKALRLRTHLAECAATALNAHGHIAL